MKKLLFILSSILLVGAAQAKDYAISTPNTTLIVSANTGETLMFRYYGSRAEIEDVRAAGRLLKYDAYPAYGTRCERPFASLVKQADGDNALKLVIESATESSENGLKKLKKVAPHVKTQWNKSYLFFVLMPTVLSILACIFS